MRLKSVPIAAAASILLSTTPWAGSPPGEALYRHCRNCHGSAGQGGESGRYPRIAGLPQLYVERQLEAFKTRKRVNKPMLPIFRDWRFDADAMRTVAAYVSAMSAEGLQLPPFEPSAEALEQFDNPEEFDQIGEEIFQDNCAQCHGEDGRGRTEKETPPLVQQFSAYLARQIDDFAAGRRFHEHAEKMFGDMYPEEREAVLAYLQRLGTP
jgi:cytochrome c553